MFLSPIMKNLFIIAVLGFTEQAYGRHKPVRRQANSTISSSQLETWWFDTGEINTQTPVQNGNVRQSHMYNVDVSTSSSGTFYQSFVHEAIPRNGNGNLCNPATPGTLCNVDDGISIEPYIGVTMAWTQFLTSTNTVVAITRTDGGSVAPSNVVVRPQTVSFSMQQVGDALEISVPYSTTGYRFSVEFQDDLYTYHNAGPGENSYYVQDTTSSGPDYVSSFDNSMPVVGIEPLNALLIFISPFPESQYIPPTSASTYDVPSGLVTSLSQVTQSVVSFGPGVYWFTGENFGNMSSSVDWVYFAPGSYVKGAIYFNSLSTSITATGFGVLSGEQYVYQANIDQGFQNIASNPDDLRMWGGNAVDDTVFTLHGVTIASQPFNSMDFSAPNLASLSTVVSDYKQVGAFFGQTDGLEIYGGSQQSHIFYHSGDDTIKTYYSNVYVNDVTVWKTNNAPILQFGWSPRECSNITVENVNVIHTRYVSQDSQYPRALVGSAVYYADQGATNASDSQVSYSNFNILNWRCEGICPGLLGINPLENIDTMLIQNVTIEQLAPNTTLVDMSTFTVFTDGINGNVPMALGNNSPNNLGLVIQDFYVGDTKILLSENNWQSNELGCLDIDAHYWGRWTVE